MTIAQRDIKLLDAGHNALYRVLAKQEKRIDALERELAKIQQPNKEKP
jgi:hypothetical protein